MMLTPEQITAIVASPPVVAACDRRQKNRLRSGRTAMPKVFLATLLNSEKQKRPVQ
jgi:hypothetical protein